MVTPLITVAVIYILGIVFAAYCFFALEFFLVALVFLFFIALICFRRSIHISKFFLFLSVFLLGCVLCNLHLRPPSPGHIKNFISPWVTGLTGTIVEEPQLKGNRLSFLLKCERWTPDFCNDTDSYPVRGLVRVNYSQDEVADLDFSYGDRVSLFGRLQEPVVLHNPILFDYKTYLRNKGIFAVFHCAEIEKLGRGSVNVLSRLVFRLRRSFKESIDRTLSGEEAGLLKGVMLGDKKDISADLRNMFISTGLAHTLAVSGLHVGLVVSIFYFFLRFLKLSKRICAIFNIPAVITYCLITGANPPAVRATILSVIVLSAILIEREPDLLNSLALAGLIILLINPLSLFDASFQLSFVATLGIIYLVPFFEKWFGYARHTEIAEGKFSPVLPRWIATPLSVSIAAQICIMPLIAYYFNKVSLIAFIANLFIVPILGVVLALGFTSAILGMVCFSLARYVAMANFALLWYFIQTIKFFGLFPFASLIVATPSPIFIAGYYLAMFTPQFKYGKWVLFSLLVASAIFIWSKIFLAPVENRLKVIFFDVGQGQSVFIRLPSRRIILIDGGNPYIGESVLLPFLREQGIWKVDAVVSTHSHADHLGGLISVIDDFKIRRVLMGEAEDSSPLSTSFWQLVRKNKIPYDMLNSGDEIRIGEREKIQVFNPPLNSSLNKDDNSLVLKLIYGKFEMLLPSDITSKIQNGLIMEFAGILNADVLQVPHHGSAEALNVDFLKVVKPEVAVMQLGKFNQFGFPGPGVIQAYEKIGTRIYRTDLHGAVQITTDGDTYSIRTYGGRE